MNSLKILPFETADLVYVSALQPDGWPDILPNMVFYDSSPLCFPIKVVDGDRMVGLGTTIVHKDTAWLAHIIVHPEYRNGGVGRMITEHLVGSLKDYPTIYLIATDLGAPVYLKLGFETETEYVFYKDISGILLPEGASGLIPYTPDFRKDILLLDQETMGEDRIALLEPHLHDAQIYLEENKLTGVFMPSLGEGLILARTPAAGLAMMQLRFQTKENAAFPVDNLHAHGFLKGLEFPELRRAKRMRLGEKRTIKPELVYSRVGGNLG